MSAWPVVVLPAIITAIVIRFDAKIIGPYFALSSLVSGTEGLWANDFYTDPARRRALIRRFLYPVILGFSLAWFVPSTVDVAGAGGITAGLLIWPILFHGMPVGVSRRDWEVPVLYASFLIAFPLLAMGGSSLKGLLMAFSNGDAPHWLAEQALWSILRWILGIMFGALYGWMFTRVKAKTIRRGEVAYENEMKRGSGSLDSQSE